MLDDFQIELSGKVDYEWGKGALVVVMRLDTGGGKTRIIAFKILQHDGLSCVIAHRQELVSQISVTLAECGVPHNIIAAEKVRKIVAREHMRRTGRVWYQPNARCTVASVDTLALRPELKAWASQVTLWVVDEAHHVLRSNKWGKVVSLFTAPGCRGLMPTATPFRPDGKGLGRHADGFADAMVEGPPMRWLIDEGYLCDYELYCPESDLVVIDEVSANGDWTPKQLREAAKKSHIVGDMVETYLKYGRGMTGVSFSTDIETATDLTQKFTDAGVRAALLTGDTDPDMRFRILAMLERREYEQIVAVDIISEGFDLPAVQYGALGRPSQSLPLYMQQFGRFLRPVFFPGQRPKTRTERLSQIAAGPKPIARIVDHVGNTVRHLGTPDKPRVWTLDGRDKRARLENGLLAPRICLECFRDFERYLAACPYCGEPIPEPEGRGSPKQVAGDIILMDPEALAILRGQIIDVDMSAGDFGLQCIANNEPKIGIARRQRIFKANQEAQRKLRVAMGLYGGMREKRDGLDDREIQREFFARFGIDVVSAQKLEAKEAQELEQRLWTEVNRP